MGVQVPDSDKDLTRDYVFEAVIPICRGPDKGSSYMTVFNDKKGVIVKKCVHRVTLGPCVLLAQKLQGQMTAPWTYCYTKHVLVFLEATLCSMLLAFDLEVRTMLGNCKWDSATWMVSSSAYTPQESGHSSLQTRLSCRNIDLEALDLSALLSYKAKVDKEMDEDEVKAQENMIEEEGQDAGGTSVPPA